jgi:hypothetical protein
VNDYAVFVAGTDQYIRALRFDNGREIWSVLTESPLTESPTVIGDRVYQQIPSQGLVCFEALPLDSPGGERIWTTAGVKGSVICQRRDNLLVWDAQGKIMTVLDVKRGGVVKTVALPQVKRMEVSAIMDGDIYAASDDGRVVRLTAK